MKRSGEPREGEHGRNHNTAHQHGDPRVRCAVLLQNHTETAK